jgi:hypothetical protein
MTLTSRQDGYGIPDNVSYFESTDFKFFQKSMIEYILTVAASMQMDFVNSNVYLIDVGFKQYVLKDPSFGGMYSLWYTSPVVFVAGNTTFTQSIPWTSFFHEMGHNFTLNTPKDYYYGGKIDGNANAIYSETMAQIFQHATVYEIINNKENYGIGEDIAADIKLSATTSIQLVRTSYENYISQGKKFTSWNDPNPSDDDTFNVFMTIAYKFFEHAENSNAGYRVPLKKMVSFLQEFNENYRAKYDQHNNTDSANSFRATFMVAALSYAFNADLRNEFRALNFPVDDEIYKELTPYLLAPPSNLTVSDVPDDNGHKLKLTWELSPDDPHGNVTSYRIFRSRSSTLTDPLPLSQFSVLDSLIFYEQRYTILIDSVSAGTIEYIDPFVPLNNVLYSYWVQATGNAGMSKRVSSYVKTKVVAVKISHEFKLGDAYPNPFNPSTTIEFTLQTPGKTTIVIYDIMGRKIRQLVTGQLSPGLHSILWDGRDDSGRAVSSGVYFALLTMGKSVAVRKMLLMK